MIYTCRIVDKRPYYSSFLTDADSDVTDDNDNDSSSLLHHSQNAGQSHDSSEGQNPEEMADHGGDFEEDGFGSDDDFNDNVLQVKVVKVT